MFVFFTVSIPGDVFRSKDMGTWDGYYRACYSFWGSKRCGPHEHNPKADGASVPNKGFPNAKVLRTMDAAVAFDIVGLATSLVCLITCILMVCKCCSAAVPLIFAVLTAVFGTVSVGCMLGAWYTKVEVPLFAVTYSLHEFSNLGYAAALLITGWCMQFVVIVLLAIGLCCCAGVSPKQEEGESGEPEKEGSHNESSEM